MIHYVQNKNAFLLFFFWCTTQHVSLSFAFFPFRPLAVFWGLKNGVMVVQKSDNTALRSETLENWKSSWLLLTQWDDCLRGTKTSVWEIKYSEIGLLQYGKLENSPGTSLVAQWLRLHLPVAGVGAWFLVGELGSHVPRGQKTET